MALISSNLSVLRFTIFLLFGTVCLLKSQASAAFQRPWSEVAGSPPPQYSPDELIKTKRTCESADPNAHWSECIRRGDRARTCVNYWDGAGLKTVYYHKWCEEGCDCKVGFVRVALNGTGRCVLPQECPDRSRCRKNSHWVPECSESAQGCEFTCGHFPLGDGKPCLNDPKNCRGGCDCKEGYIRNEHTNLCVPRVECPPKCEENAYWERGCAASAHNCADHCSSWWGVTRGLPCTHPSCTSGCDCKPGYVFYRGQSGRCVEPWRCYVPFSDLSWGW